MLGFSLSIVYLTFLYAQSFSINSDVDVYDPRQVFQFHAELDTEQKYWLFWTPDDNSSTITFEVHVEAHGYVGFGLSPNGGMPGSDVVIGWVHDSDGIAYFHDRHADDTAEPDIDDVQDWTLLSANQNDTHTILRFSRPYYTCDGEDFDITTDTIRVIYSFTDSDPEDITGLDYHGSNRGTRSLLLRSYNLAGESLPEDAISVDFMISENVIPNVRTTYRCEILPVEQKSQKHHVVMFEPIITPGNEGFIHHVVMFACTSDVPDHQAGTSWDCYNEAMDFADYCREVWFVWGVGGNSVYFPEHTGMPMFDSESATLPKFFVMEMHYDNPNSIAGVSDSSGLRLWMTPTLRENEIGVLLTGVPVLKSMIIPPKFDGLVTRGHCVPECSDEAIDDGDDETDDDSINVFAVFQHGHLLAKAMYTNVKRNGNQLEPLLVDKTYDFNYQQTKLLKEERVLYKGDVVSHDCIYQSTDKNEITTGGYATIEEMCESFIYYYPKRITAYCSTNPTEYNMIKAVEDIEILHTLDYPFYEIVSPPEYVGLNTQEVFALLDWTDESLRERFQNITLQEDVKRLSLCSLSDGTFVGNFVDTPAQGEPWQDPNGDVCVDQK